MSGRVTALGLGMLMAGAAGLLAWVHGPMPRGSESPALGLALLVWAAAGWWVLDRLAAWADAPGRSAGAAGSARPWPERAAAVARLLAAPALLGATLIFVWEVAVVGWEVPRVLLPAPHAVWDALLNRWEVLGRDFRQTATGVVAGFAIGSGAGLAVALLADRFDFLRRGLLPLANLAGAVPIIGIAPIMVMWFGFDWQSKAAVAAVVCFFPMLVNTLAGLATVDPMHRDLMRTYACLLYTSPSPRD